MEIASVFEDQQPIPAKFTCSGENVSPPLQFLQVPPKAKSLVLIVDDPDAPHGTFDHWVVWNIPPGVTALSQGAPELLKGSPRPMQGRNGYSTNEYKGPCPPPGKPHHYHFRLYAIDATLNLPQGATKQQVESAIQTHIIDQATLIGTYQRTP